MTRAMIPEADQARFWSKVDVCGPDDCWTWLGAIRSRERNRNYGYFPIGRKNFQAHRLSWELANNAAIGDGLVARHICDNPQCVNPSHIEPGTRRDNSQDSLKRGRHWRAARTHCIYGHPFVPENIWYGGDGSRICRTCARDRRRRAHYVRPSRAAKDVSA